MRVVIVNDIPSTAAGANAAAAPPPLFLDFVNTLHWDEGEPIELIGSEAELAAWLTERNLPARQLRGCLPSVHGLRRHVRATIESLCAGQMLADPEFDSLNTALVAPTGRLVVIDGNTPRPRLAFATNATDSRLLMFQVALSLATFLEFGDRRRLKLCANPGCGFAFLDTSINATRRWCYMRYCGNRLKARAFRGRNRERAAAAGNT